MQWKMTILIYTSELLKVCYVVIKYAEVLYDIQTNIENIFNIGF